jgi:hypothetical protein
VSRASLLLGCQRKKAGEWPPTKVLLRREGYEHSVIC